MIGRVKRKTISETDHPGKREPGQLPLSRSSTHQCVALVVSKGEERDGSRGSNEGGKTSLSV